MAKKVAGPVARLLTRLGMFDLSWTDSPSRVNGIPFTVLAVRKKADTYTRPRSLSTSEGRVFIDWMATNDIENDEVRLRAVDFAPMLVAWVESERKARSE